MQVGEAEIQRVLEGSRQFLVPHYQRPYSWREEQWKTLWRDLLELVEEADPKPHFLGSIVTAPAKSVPEGVAKRLLIDGQQRLTSVLVLLTLIRDRAREGGAARLADKVQDLITNRHEDGSDHFKLLPTQGEEPTDSDRDTFIKLVRGDGDAGKQGIAAAYTFFSTRLRRSDAPDLDALFRVIVTKLTLVSIILDDKDNPHRIFESLNGKGRPLSQADLIRNYFFMRIDAREHDHVYRELWRPMQRRLGEDALPDFVRHYLMRSGETIRETDVYIALKERVDDDAARSPLDHLEDLVRFANYYEVLLHPHRANGAVRERLERLNRLEVTVAYPFLLSVIADHAAGVRSETEVCATLDALENFLIRRFVCGVPTHGLNRVFPPLYSQATQGSSFIENLHRILSANPRNYPRDTDFRERLASARLYGGGDRREKTKLMLERFETAAGHKERVETETLTIEHVMPQTLNDLWRAQLGPNWEDDHEQLLHTLGNLTLTSYNSELGNAPYGEKRARFGESHLELNKYFGSVEDWNATEIERRAEVLIDQALSIWPYFGSSQRDEAENIADEPVVTGSAPRVVRMRGEEVGVQSWVDVAVVTAEGILRVGDEEFRRVVSELPKFLNFDATAFRRSSRLRRLSNGAYLETNLSAAAIHRLCVQSVQIAGIGPDEWAVVYDRTLAVSSDGDDAFGKRSAYQTFFQKLIDELRERHQFTNARIGQPQNWYSFTSEAQGFKYSFNFATGGRLRSEVYIDVGDRDTNKAVFEKLIADRAAIDAEFGEPLAWERLDQRQACRVACYHNGAVTDAPEKLDEHLRWAVEHLLRFKKVFGPRIRTVSSQLPR